jgi:hypothetical protein
MRAGLVTLVVRNPLLIPVQNRSDRRLGDPVLAEVLYLHMRCVSESAISSRLGKRYKFDTRGDTRGDSD